MRVGEVPIEINFCDGPGEPPIIRAYLPDREITPEEYQGIVDRMEKVSEEVRRGMAFGTA